MAGIYYGLDAIPGKWLSHACQDDLDQLFNAFSRRGKAQMNARLDLPSLSKSRFMAGLQCHKRLYLETHQPELVTLPDESGEAILRLDRLLENSPKALPGRQAIADDLSWDEAQSETRTALRYTAIPAIFEAAFIHRNIRVRPDVLVRTKNRQFDLYEVKATLSKTRA